MTALKAPRAPRTTEQATELLEEIARLDGEAATINANRDAAIAATNAVADALLVPVVTRRGAVADVIEAWWRQAGHALLPAKRKTMELGGCTIGNKTGPVSLTFALGDDQLAAKTLHENRWSKEYARVTVTVDKTATKKALQGRDGDRLRALGFGTAGGADVFVLATVAQAGTVEAR